MVPPATRQPARRRLPDLRPLLTPERLRRYPLALLAATAIAYALTLTRSENLIEPGGTIVGHDFFAFHMAGDMVASGHAGDLYDPAAQSAWQQEFMSPINPRWTGTCLYLNPPHYAWLLSLINPLGYPASLAVWWAASAGAFGLALRLWRPLVGTDHFTTVVVLAVATPPFFSAMAGGQNSCFSLLILTICCRLLLAGREAWAGLALALLAYKFQLLIVPSLFLVITGRWKAIAGLAAGAAATLGLTLLTTGPQSVTEYVRFASGLSALMQQQGFDVYKQHSLHGFFQLLGGGAWPVESVRILTITGCIAVLLIALPAARGGVPRDGSALRLRLAVVLLATLLTSPHLFHYDLLLLLLPAVLAPPGRAGHEYEPALPLLLLLGFAWLAVGAPLAEALRVQLSPVLMLGWLLVLRRRLVAPGAVRAARAPAAASA